MITTRIRGTREEIVKYLDHLSNDDGITVLMASKLYKDNDSLYYRVYLEVELNPKKTNRKALKK